MLLLLLVLAFSIMLYLPHYGRKKLEAYVTAHTDYRLTIRRASVGLSSLTIYEAELTPKETKADFFKRKGYQTDWIKAEVSRIQLEGIRWMDLLKQNNLKLHSVGIEGAKVYVFRDKRLPDPHRYKPLPTASLRNMPFRFAIPELNITESQVIYEEFTAKTTEVVTVPFKDLEATITHLGSDELFLSQHPVMEIEASASILDSIRTSVHYRADVRDSNSTFSLEGHTNGFSATYLNRCIEPAAHTRITSGLIRKISFSFTANEEEANGVMNMDYENLKIEVDKQEQQHRLKSLLANILIRDKDVKQVQDKYTGTIHFERRKDRFIFNYWWNAFKSGIINTVLKKPVKPA